MTGVGYAVDMDDVAVVRRKCVLSHWEVFGSKVKSG